MSQWTLGGHAFEFTRRNRALAQRALPGSREELIERLWSRKRQLLRQAAKHDGYGPEFPMV
jgi:hypothetical protein